MISGEWEEVHTCEEDDGPSGWAADSVGDLLHVEEVVGEGYVAAICRPFERVCRIALHVESWGEYCAARLLHIYKERLDKCVAARRLDSNGWAASPLELD